MNKTLFLIREFRIKLKLKLNVINKIDSEIEFIIKFEIP